MEFLAENNVCGQTILNLVSWGNAIIAELLRLSDFIPAVFNNEVQHKNELIKYAELSSDFTYFKCPEYFENTITSKMGLEELDEEFKDNYLPILTRFYQAFQSVHQYITDLNRFIEDLENGIFIQQSLESVMHNEDGKQLMCEAVYLYGIILLVLDLKIEGLVREKILVSYYRYSASKSVESNIDEVCKMLRDTGFSALNFRRPIDYPESFFSRVPPNKKLVSMVLSHLRSDDIYNQIPAYSDPSYRSTALSTQAAMLYVVLYFSPEILQGQQSTMREIVDKFFPDNWVLNIYMGIIINLCEAWVPYKAAYQALNNTLDFNNVKNMAIYHGQNANQLLIKLQTNLKQGVLTNGYVADNLKCLLNTVRMSNVTVRWLMLHTMSKSYTDSFKKCRNICEQVIQYCTCNKESLFELLLLIADFELSLKEVLKKLLDEKKPIWEEHKNASTERMDELSVLFSGSSALSRIEKNENLKSWFGEIGKQIKMLDYENSTAAGNTIIHLIQALEEVQEFHQLDSNLQVKQFLEDTRKYLHQMFMIFNINEGTLITLQIVTDLSYAWNIIDKFTPVMQHGIKKDPTLVIKLKSAFLKLASALDLPLLRINQSNSSDLISVSQYYSGELVAYVRKVLQVIPKTMFIMLIKIIDLQTKDIKEVPTRLDKDKMRDYSQLSERYEVAKCTHYISILAEGMLMMKSTHIGIIKIESKQLLEDGIRKELVNRVAAALNELLIFSIKGKAADLVSKLDEVGVIMDGYRRSFEYIQDYVNIYGLKIWQGEISRIINYNVEQECNSFLRNKVLDWQSIYQSKAVPIPCFPLIDSSVNFVGRLAREIIRITDPGLTVFLDYMHTWYDSKSKVEVVTMKLFEKLEKSVGTWGLTGVDKLIGFMIVQSLQDFKNFLTTKIMSDKFVMEMISKIDVLSNTGTNIQRIVTQVQNRLTKLFSQYLDIILKVGQMQLLRKSISHQLSLLCKFDSKYFSANMNNFNNSLLAEVEGHYCDHAQPMPKDNNPILYETSSYLDSSGLNDPLRKIYISTHESSHFATLNFVLINYFLHKLTFVKSLNAFLSRKSSDNIDGIPFVVGIVTVFKQYHYGNSDQFISLLSKYSKHLIQTNYSNSQTLHPDCTSLNFLEQFIAYSHCIGHIP